MFTSQARVACNQPATIVKYRPCLTGFSVVGEVEVHSGRWHRGAGARDVLTYREGEQKRSRRSMKLFAAFASISIASMGLIVTMTVAVNPSYIGRYFTLYEEREGSNLVYKIEARITEVTAEGVKAAQINIEFKVTNKHPFGIHLIFSYFWVEDIRTHKTALTVLLPESIIEKQSIQHILTTGKVTKIYGLGYRFLVSGQIIWSEIRPSGEVGPFQMDFHEFHSPAEFVHNW